MNRQTRKKIISLVIIFALILTNVGVFAAADEPIQLGVIKDLFPDEYLAEAVAEKFWGDNAKTVDSTVTQEELNTITSLYLSNHYGNAPINSLAGIHALCMLSDIALESQPLSDLTPLAGAKFSSISITNCPNVTNLDFLENSKNTLESFSIDNSGVSNVSILNEMASLKYVEVSNLPVSGALDLSENAGLKSVKLSNTALTSLTLDGSFDHLDRMMVDNNSLTSIELSGDFSVLSEITAKNNALTSFELDGSYPCLSSVYVSNNALTSLAFDGASTPNLGTLQADDNKLSSLTLSGNLPNLRYVTANNNALTSFSFDDEGVFSDFQYLSVNDNKLTSLAPLGRFVTLSTIYASNNELTSLGDLSGLVWLSELDVSGNKLTSLAKLPPAVEHEYYTAGISNLNASNNLISNIDALHGMVSMANLYLANNEIYKDPNFAATLATMKKMYSLDLSGNNLLAVYSDGSGLFDFLDDYTELYELWISDNGLTTDMMSMLAFVDRSYGAFDISHNNFTDISWLPEGIGNLYLGFNESIDLSFIDSKAYSFLDISGIGRRALTAMLTLSGIGHIDLSYNELTDEDLEIFGELSGVLTKEPDVTYPSFNPDGCYLDLSGNDINNLDIVSYISPFNYGQFELILDDTNIKLSEPSDIKALTDLTYESGYTLSFRNCGLENVDAFNAFSEAGLKWVNLRLILDDNAISDISPLYVFIKRVFEDKTYNGLPIRLISVQDQQITREKLTATPVSDEAVVGIMGAAMMHKEITVNNSGVYDNTVEPPMVEWPSITSGTGSASYNFQHFRTVAIGQNPTRNMALPHGENGIVYSGTVVVPYELGGGTVPPGPSKYSVTYDANGGDGSLTDTDSPYASGATVTVLSPGSAITPKEGFRFTGWNTSAAGTGKSYAAGDTFKITANTTLYAQWAKVESCTVTYDANGGTGTLTDAKSPYESGSTVKVLSPLGAISSTGHGFIKWNTKADGSGTSYLPGGTFVITEDTTLYAQWQGYFDPGNPDTEITDPIPPLGPWDLNLEDHFAYIVGYPDGTVRPSGKITREEVATIFFRLLTEETRNTIMTRENSFADVESDRWSNLAISTLSSVGIVQGYEDGSFAPSGFITRAEFAAIASRFDTTEIEAHVVFTDTEGHWAEDEISRAACLGWIQGRPDGSFGPNEQITRAEVATFVNRMLLRLVADESALLPEMKTWPDNADTGAWFYLDIQEATNAHLYERIEGSLYENWVELMENYDWTKLEQGN